MDVSRSKKVTWEAINGTPEHERTRSMKEVVAKLQHYIATYDSQYGYEEFRDYTLIDDVLYGLGQALDKKYEYANGFILFKKEILFPHLGVTNEESIHDEHVCKE